MLRERDELQNMLEKHERHLSEIQANVKVLTAERDKTRMHYQQVDSSKPPRILQLMTHTHSIKKTKNENHIVNS